MEFELNVESCFLILILKSFRVSSPFLTTNRNIANECLTALRRGPSTYGCVVIVQWPTWVMHRTS